jgi:hypothetical protein
LLLTLASTLQPQQPPPAAKTALILGEDTPIAVRLTEGISSESAAVNDRVEFEVAEDVRVQQMVVIPKGSYAWGIVTNTARKSRMRRNGKLDIDLEAVCLPNGKPAPLRAMRRGSLHPDNAEVSASDSLFALPALPVMLFVWGKDVSIPEGREFTTYLAEDTPLEASLLRTRPVPISECTEAAADPGPVPQLAQAPTRQELSTVNVRSTPANAEIYVDDRFMGNTPAVLRLPPGEHQIRLVAPGFSHWERLIAATPGGDANVQVKLESTVLVQK